MASKALSNDDILHAIFQYCSKQDIQSLRQCSRQLELVASHYLFKTLIFGFRKRYLRRLNRIAASEKFSKGVREIVWETASYQTRDKPSYGPGIVTGVLIESGTLEAEDMLAREEYCWNRMQITVARLNALAKDEAAASKDSHSFLLDLIMGLKALSGLRRVTFTTWQRDHESFLRKESLLAEDSAMPPPFQVLVDNKEAIAHQGSSVATVLFALGLAERELTSLSVFPTPNTVLGTRAAQRFGFPGFCITFSELFARAGDFMDTGMLPLRTLRELRLDIGDQNVPGLPQTSFLKHCVKDYGLRRFLSAFRELESLSIRLHSFAEAPPFFIHAVVVPFDQIFGEFTYPKLRHVHFDSMWLDSSGELCDFLAAHAATLDTVELSNINIGGVREAMSEETGVARLLVPGLRQHIFSPSPLHPEWLGVAEACQKLSQLNGLIIESPSVSEEWTYLSLFDTEELMEIGMNGRENKLYSGTQLGV